MQHLTSSVLLQLAKHALEQCDTKLAQLLLAKSYNTKSMESVNV
mgnify:CR=1 FL=1